MAELPHPYAVALRLHAAGRPPSEIAIALDIADDSVPTVLRIGREKLAQLLESAHGHADGTDIA